MSHLSESRAIHSCPFLSVATTHAICKYRMRRFLHALPGYPAIVRLIWDRLVEAKFSVFAPRPFHRLSRLPRSPGPSFPWNLARTGSHVSPLPTSYISHLFSRQTCVSLFIPISAILSSTLYKTSSSHLQRFARPFYRQPQEAAFQFCSQYHPKSYCFPFYTQFWFTPIPSGVFGD